MPLTSFFELQLLKYGLGLLPFIFPQNISKLITLLDGNFAFTILVFISDEKCEFFDDGTGVDILE
jgi:hypothetical protein